MMKKYPPFRKPRKKGLTLSVATIMKMKQSWLEFFSSKSYKMYMGQNKLPGLGVYTLNDPDFVHRALVEDSEKFSQHDIVGKILKPVVGETIFIDDRNRLGEIENIVISGLEALGDEKIASIVNNAVDEMIKRLSKRKEKSLGVTHIEREMSVVCSDITSRLLFDEKIRTKDIDKILSSFASFQKDTAANIMLNVFKIGSWLNSGSSNRRAVESALKIRSIMENFTSRCEKRYKSGKCNDTLYAYLRSAELPSGKRFDEKEMMDIVSLIFLLSYEIISSSLSWALYLIGAYPGFAQKCREEIEEEGGDKIFEMPRSFKKMKRVQRLMKETKRLYPPVGLMARRVEESMEIRGKKIKKGDFIFISPWLIHRHKEFWRNPNQFLPARFSKGEPFHEYAYLPYGTYDMDKRFKKLLKTIEGIVIGKMLREFDIEVSDECSEELIASFTITLEGGILLSLKKR